MGIMLSEKTNSFRILKTNLFIRLRKKFRQAEFQSIFYKVYIQELDKTYLEVSLKFKKNKNKIN